MVGLTLLNAATSPDEWWVVWPWWVWGTAVASHAGAVLVPRARRLGGHVALFAVANLGFLAIDLGVDSGGLEWAPWPLWVWGGVLATHAATVLVPGGRPLAAHAAAFVVANLGFVAIDLVHGGLDWSFWPLGGWGILLAAHAGLTMTGRDDETVGAAGVGPSGVAVAPLGAVAPLAGVGVPPAVPTTRSSGAVDRPEVAARGTPRGLRVAEAFLAVVAAMMVLGATGIGVNQALTVRGSGVPTVAERTVPPFTSVAVHGDGDLVVTQVEGATPTLRIEGDDNLVPLVDTSVEGGQLEIEARWGWLRSLDPAVPLRFFVTVPELTALRVDGNARASAASLVAPELSVTVNGGGSCRIGNLETERLTASINGGGDLEVAGSAGVQAVSVNGAGDYHARRLTSRTATVTVNGAGGAIVAASERLDLTVNGAGSIGYATLAADTVVRDQEHGVGDIYEVRAER